MALSTGVSMIYRISTLVLIGLVVATNVHGKSDSPSTYGGFEIRPSGYFPAAFTLGVMPKGGTSGYGIGVFGNIGASADRDIPYSNPKGGHYNAPWGLFFEWRNLKPKKLGWYTFLSGDLGVSFDKIKDAEDNRGNPVSYSGTILLANSWFNVGYARRGKDKNRNVFFFGVGLAVTSFGSSALNKQFQDIGGATTVAEFGVGIRVGWELDLLQ